MSQIYRLFGLEFTPARLEMKLPNFEKSGFEVGCVLGFDRNGRSIREHNIFDVLGLKSDSETAIQFEEDIRFGHADLYDYVRDVIAGYEHAKAHMKMATEACLKLSHCLYFFGRKRQDFCMQFPSEVLARFSETEFLVKQAGDVAIKSSDVFQHPVNLVSGHLLVGRDQVDLAIHPDMEYDQNSCRAIHNYIGVILDTLYAAMEEVMAAEQQEEVIRRIRADIEGKVKHDVLGCNLPEHCPEVPNFYLTKE
jgi:hypothetical protein